MESPKSPRIPKLMGLLGFKGASKTDSFSIEEHESVSFYMDAVKGLYNLLFDVWKEDEDPSLYYFPTVQSYTD